MPAPFLFLTPKVREGSEKAGSLVRSLLGDTAEASDVAQASLDSLVRTLSRVADEGGPEGLSQAEKAVLDRFAVSRTREPLSLLYASILRMELNRRLRHSD